MHYSARLVLCSPQNGLLCLMSPSSLPRRAEEKTQNEKEKFWAGLSETGGLQQSTKNMISQLPSIAGCSPAPMTLVSVPEGLRACWYLPCRKEAPSIIRDHLAADLVVEQALFRFTAQGKQ